MILVAGIEYANDLSQWLQNQPSDPANNLAVCWHVYPNSNYPGSHIERRLSAGIAAAAQPARDRRPGFSFERRMIFPLIGVRLHGWLDDLVVIVYLLGAAALHLRGAALAVALAGAGVHFLLTRLTNYPQGTVKIIPFRVHAFIELTEGACVLAIASVAPFGLGASPLSTRLFLGLLGLSQFAAFSFSDYQTAPQSRRT